MKKNRITDRKIGYDSSIKSGIFNKNFVINIGLD